MSKTVSARPQVFDLPKAKSLSRKGLRTLDDFGSETFKN